MTNSPAPPPLLPSEARPVRWGLGDALLAGATGYLVAIMVSAIWVGATGDARVTWGLTVLSTMGLWAGFAGIPWLVSLRKGRGSLAQDYGWRLNPRVDIAVGVVAALVTQFVVLRLITYGFSLLEPDIRLSQGAQDMAEDVDALRFAVLAVVFVVGAPLAEELFFRGILLRSLVRRWGPVAGVVVSGVLFGLVHTEGGNAASVGAVVTSLAVLGIVLAWLTERYGRMGPAIAAHVTFNLVAVIDLASRR